MLVVVLAHQVGGFQRLVGIVRGSRDFVADLLAYRIRRVRLLRIATRIHRPQDVNRVSLVSSVTLGAVLRKTQRRKQSQEGGNFRMSQPETQENLQPGGKL